MFYLVSNTKWTLKFEWCMFGCESKDMHHKNVLNRDWIMWLFDNNYKHNSQHHWEDLCDNVMTRRIIILTFDTRSKNNEASNPYPTTSGLNDDLSVCLRLAYLMQQSNFCNINPYDHWTRGHEGPCSMIYKLCDWSRSRRPCRIKGPKKIKCMNNIHGSKDSEKSNIWEVYMVFHMITNGYHF